MVPRPFPYLKCPVCATQILFPSASPQGTLEQPHRWPAGTWKIFLLCPGCQRVRLYQRRDVETANPQTWGLDPLVPGDLGARPSFFRIEHRCGYDNCGLPHVLFVTSWRYQTERALQQQARAARPRTQCANGHKFKSWFEFVSVKEVFSLA
jgi:hypothetical protein